MSSIKFDGAFRIGGRLITKLRCAEGNVFIALQELVRQLHGTSARVKMKIDVKKTEVMKVCESEIPINIIIGGIQVKKMHSFKAK